MRPEETITSGSEEIKTLPEKTTSSKTPKAVTFAPKAVTFGLKTRLNLQEKTANSERKRSIHFFRLEGKDLHGPKSPIQAFVNNIEPDSYVCPHKHEAYNISEAITTLSTKKQLEQSPIAWCLIPLLKEKLKKLGDDTTLKRWELFVIMQGKAKVILFTDTGMVSDALFLSDEPEANQVAIIPSNTYHTVVSIEKNTMMFELKNGWYDGNKDKKMPSWAPKEECTESLDFLKWLKIAKMNQNVKEYKNYLDKRMSSLNNTLINHTKEKNHKKEKTYIETMRTFFCCST